MAKFIELHVYEGEDNFRRPIYKKHVFNVDRVVWIKAVPSVQHINATVSTTVGLFNVREEYQVITSLLENIDGQS